MTLAGAAPLVDRLRAMDPGGYYPDLAALHREAADRIETLERDARMAEQHRRLCLAEGAGPAVWPCGCNAQITDSFGSRKLVGEPCDLHEQLLADGRAAGLREAADTVDAQRREWFTGVGSAKEWAREALRILADKLRALASEADQ